MKKIAAVLLILLCPGLLAACGGGEAPPAPDASTTQGPAEGTGNQGVSDGYHPVFTDADLSPDWEDSAAVHITFSGSSAHVDGEGAFAAEGGVKISQGGIYVLSGTLDDGRVVADVQPGEALIIVLNGVNMSCSVSAPLYISNGDAVIVLPEGTKNVLSDAAAYQYANEAVKEPNACIYGDDDLSIVGAGELEIQANFNNGIGTKDELRIASVKVTVRAVNNALKGNDCVLIRDADIRLESGGDGIKSDEESAEGYGVIEISNSRLSITAQDDALQAISRITVLDGEILTDVQGKKVNCDGVVAISEGVLK